MCPIQQHLTSMDIIATIRKKKTYLWKGSMRQKDATHSKIPPDSEKAIPKRMALRVRGQDTVGSGREWSEGHAASQTRGCCSGTRAPVYGPRVGRWCLQAFGCVFDLDHQCTRSHLGDWPGCMGRTLGECHHISMSENRTALAGELSG